MYKRTLIIFGFACIFNCCTNKAPETVPATVLNKDSLAGIAADMKMHRELVSEVFKRLNLDSLNPGDSEAYRFIIREGWGPGPMMGSPMAITFYKKFDTAFVVIKERRRTPDTSLYKWTKFIAVSRFDSVRTMFDSAFWRAPVTDFNCDRLVLDGSRYVWEAQNGKRHKLKSQRNCVDTTVFNSMKINLIELAEYSKEVLDDIKWFRENPPCCIKTPGPPSELRMKKK